MEAILSGSYGAGEDDCSHLCNGVGGFTCWIKTDELTLHTLGKKWIMEEM